MSRQSKLIYAILNYYEHYYNKGKGLELHNYDIIQYRGNNVGYVVNDSEISSYTFIVLTLDRIWLPKRILDGLVQEANRNNMKVVFVPRVDVGFGFHRSNPSTINEPILSKFLISKVAYHSQDDDIKTAVCVLQNGHPIVFSYNQKLDERDTFIHAEDVVAEFLQMESHINQDYNLDQPVQWYMLLEPCEHCLRAMLDSNTNLIQYYYPHKDKWNTSSYIQLVNDVQSGLIRNGKSSYKNKIKFGKIKGDLK